MTINLKTMLIFRIVTVTESPLPVYVALLSPHIISSESWSASMLFNHASSFFGFISENSLKPMFGIRIGSLRFALRAFHLLWCISVIWRLSPPSMTYEYLERFSLCHKVCGEQSADWLFTLTYSETLLWDGAKWNSNICKCFFEIKAPNRRLWHKLSEIFHG